MVEMHKYRKLVPFSLYHYSMKAFLVKKSKHFMRKFRLKNSDIMNKTVKSGKNHKEMIRPTYTYLICSNSYFLLLFLATFLIAIFLLQVFLQAKT